MITPLILFHNQYDSLVQLLYFSLLQWHIPWNSSQLLQFVNVLLVLALTTWNLHSSCVLEYVVCIIFIAQIAIYDNEKQQQ